MMRLTAAVLLLMISAASSAAEDLAVQFEMLDGDVQQLKNELLELSTEITRVERQIYPERSTVKLFFRVGEPANHDPASAVVRIDGEIVGAHIYTDTENAALVEGGVQPLYDGFTVSGEHEISVSMVLRADDGTSRQITADAAFTKRDRSVLLEALLISDAAEGLSLQLTEH